jgi:hypothetical protein
MRTPHEFRVEVFLNQPANSNGQVFLRLFSDGKYLYAQIMLIYQLQILYLQ